jgi:hypothetical protein
MFGMKLGSILDDSAHEALAADVAELLHRLFRDVRSPLSGLDRWTERRIREENLAKTALVLEADDPVEHCYQNLIREIDTEARNGIFLADPAASAKALRRIAGESGVSGELGRHIGRLAPTLFPDETAHSDARLDVVWTSLRARFDRANAEARVSELIMTRLLGDADAATDMSDALRALFFAWHEDQVRRGADLEVLLSEQETADLATMVAELAVRSGSYAERVAVICARSDKA